MDFNSNNLMNTKTFAKQMNNYAFTIYYYQLSLLAMSLFEWKGLPNGIDEKWIEKYLFSNGECMFFKDNNLGLMVAKTTRNGFNHYDEPINLKPVSKSPFVDHKDYKVGSECVLIRNNDLSLPTDHVVKLFAYEISDIKRTQQINVNAQKTPILVLCNDKQKLTLKNIYAQYTGNEPVIFADKNFMGNNAKDILSVLKTDSPIVFDKLEIHKHQVFNEFLTFIGINNANMDKKERLVDDEVQANNEVVEYFGETLLKARKQACKEINKLFGTNISVERRIQKQAENEPLNEDSEDDSEGSESEVA